MNSKDFVHNVPKYIFRISPEPTTPLPTTTGAYECPENTTSCEDGSVCYGPEKHCDGEPICIDGSDEFDCPCHYNGTTIEVC